MGRRRRSGRLRRVAVMDVFREAIRTSEVGWFFDAFRWNVFVLKRAPQLKRI
jgi:hypothetical protein